MSLKRWAVLCAVVAGATMLAANGPAAVQEKSASAAIPTEAFAELPAMESPQISPNGKLLAAKIAVEGVQYLAIMSLEGKEPQLVGLGEADLNWWHWLNDAWLVTGVGKVYPVEGLDFYISRSIGVPVGKGKKMFSLSPPNAGQSADDVLWYARDGSARVLLASQTSIYSNDEGFYPSVEEINLDKRSRKPVLRPRAGVMGWYADGRGVVRMGISRSNGGLSARVLYRDASNQNFRVIDRTTKTDDDLSYPAMFLDAPGKALTYDDAEGYNAVYELDLATMQRGKQVFASKGYDIGELIPNDSSSGYLGVETREDRPAVRWTDPEMQAIAAEARAQVKGAGVATDIVSLSRDHKRVVLLVSAVDTAGAYFVFDRASGQVVPLGKVNKTLKLRRMNPVRTIRYKARDGLEIAAVLTLPRGKSTDLPLIVMPHGGPQARDSEEWDWWSQFLAERGYAVIQPNYRGSTGYGTTFLKKGEGQWGLAMQDDLNDAISALAKQKIADPKRVCIVGASYGGYAALRAAQRDGALYRCAVSYAGVSDMNLIQSYNRHFLYGASRKKHLLKQAPDLRLVSPANYAGEFTIPTLLMHGKKDIVVPVKHSRVMAERLRAAGKPVEYVEQREGDHHFSRAADRLEFLKALEAFLAKHNPA